MKTFLRAMAGFMLVVVLCSFTMWRQNAFPDLSGITSFVMDTAGRLNNIQQGGSFLGTGGRQHDENAEFPEYDLSEELNPEIEEYIYNAMLRREERIDVSECDFSESSLQKAVSRIRFLHPDLFFVDKTFGVQPDEGDPSKIRWLKPHYLYSGSEHDEKMAAYENHVRTIAAAAPADGTDFDKLLYLHDYFIREYSYDYSYTIRDAYTFFEQKTGVCQAYMLALIAVAGELGIESIPVTSPRMNHAWNLVKLDGNWYHVDVTWDDTGAYPSQTSYAYFLQSDAGIIDIDRDRINESMDEPDWHCDWETTQKATETRYDNAVWRKSHTPIVKSNGSYYCVAYTGIDEATGRSGAIFTGESPTAMSELQAIRSIWRLNGGNQYYMSCYAGLAVYGDLLIYNTHNSLRAYHLKENRDFLLSLFPQIGTDCIFGITSVSKNGTVTFLVSGAVSGSTYYLMDYTVS